MSWWGPNRAPMWGEHPMSVMRPPEPLPPLDHVDRYITGLGAAPPRIPDLLPNPVRDWFLDPPVTRMPLLPDPPFMDLTVFKPKPMFPDPEPIGFVPSWERPKKLPNIWEEPMFVLGEVKKRR